MIFSKVPALKNVHEDLFKQLKDSLINPDFLVGKTWAYGANDLEKVYPPYINSYDEALKTLDYCEQNRPKFYTFLKMAESKPECQKNGLKDLLIRPVQRIPSVLLILQGLRFAIGFVVGGNFEMWLFL